MCAVAVNICMFAWSTNIWSYKVHFGFGVTEHFQELYGTFCGVLLNIFDTCHLQGISTCNWMKVALLFLTLLSTSTYVVAMTTSQLPHVFQYGVAVQCFYDITHSVYCKRLSEVFFTIRKQEVWHGSPTIKAPTWSNRVLRHSVTPVPVLVKSLISSLTFLETNNMSPWWWLPETVWHHP